MIHFKWFMMILSALNHLANKWLLALFWIMLKAFGEFICTNKMDFIISEYIPQYNLRLHLQHLRMDIVGSSLLAVIEAFIGICSHRIQWRSGGVSIKSISKDRESQWALRVSVKIEYQWALRVSVSICWFNSVFSYSANLKQILITSLIKWLFYWTQFIGKFMLSLQNVLILTLFNTNKSSIIIRAKKALKTTQNNH